MIYRAKLEKFFDENFHNDRGQFLTQNRQLMTSYREMQKMQTVLW